jgi:hypothetical protein
MSRASEQFLAEIRDARERLIETRLTDTALTYCIAGLSRIEEALRRPVRVVILGEYNSGKTSVADLLIGAGLLPTSVVANTQVPVLMTYAETASMFGVTEAGTRIRVDGEENDPLTDIAFRAIQVALPLEHLRRLQILDTPSAASPAAFIEDADIVIWCTVATRAWTESERALWASLPPRCCRNALLVATHKDSLHLAEEVTSVTERLRAMTTGLFRDIVLVAAEGGRDDGAAGHAGATDTGAATLRNAVASLAGEIADRRTHKAEKIVRRLGRLTFHHLSSARLRPEIAILLTDWESRSGLIVEQLTAGTRTVPSAIEELLQAYAGFAELLSPGVILGDSIPITTARALTAPLHWPANGAAAQRLVKTLVSDLTALLRMLAARSTAASPRHGDYQTARGILLALADLDGSFAALERMLGSSTPDAPA